MRTSLDRFSFAFGFIFATILACALVAAAYAFQPKQRYTATPVMGGIGLHILDHESNTLFGYRRSKNDGEFALFERLDLSQTGNKSMKFDVFEEKEKKDDKE